MSSRASSAVREPRARRVGIFEQNGTLILKQGVISGVDARGTDFEPVVQHVSS